MHSDGWVVTCGYGLRVIVKVLRQMTNEQITDYNNTIAIPFIFQMDHGLKVRK